MFLSIMFTSMLALASPRCDCMLGGWKDVVDRTEALVVHREPLRVPRDPLGTVYDPSCVRLTFGIDSDGLPVNVKIDRSSRNRALDLAAREAVKRYKFLSRASSSSDEVFALVFEVGAVKDHESMHRRSGSNQRGRG